MCFTGTPCICTSGCVLPGHLVDYMYQCCSTASLRNTQNISNHQFHTLIKLLNYNINDMSE